MVNNDEFSKLLKGNHGKRYSETDAYESMYGLYIEEAMRKKQVGFARLPDITDYLKDLTKTTGALYMFYALKAKNNTGKSYWSADKIAEQLGVVPKTINNANRELQDLGLIYRESGTGGKTSNTYLLPPNSFLITEDSEKSKSVLSSDIFIQGIRPALSIKVGEKNFVNYVLYKIKKADDKYPVYAITVKYNQETPEAQGKLIDPDSVEMQDDEIQARLKILSDAKSDHKDKIEIILNLAPGL